ncbi:MAG: RHS repeat-associated core domain-containing protein, partial [Armatimonadota bacterium]|nr:RHS repeat-associated core domain-containing protein [Armatimonadota bacterium]
MELDGQGNVTALNTFGPTGLLSRHTGTGSTFYTFDAQGSVAQRLDSSGNVQSSDVYEAFGSRLSGSSTDPWGYNAQAGYYTDAETGLILCTHRYYDPTQGRRDPIGYAGGVNLYGYVGNGPVGGVDPREL